MPQIINTNIASINAQRNLDKSQSANQTALQRLSSGLRINSAKDDAAGLAISTRFDSQIRGLNVSIRNAGDGVSLAQTAEGALGSITNNLLRIRDLALQSANGTNSAIDREALDQEVQQLKAEIKRVSDQTNFNGTKLLDGSFSDVAFQIGANEGETVTVSIEGSTVDQLGAALGDGITSDADNNPMTAGDLVINGIAVGASSGTDDAFSSANQDSSAISKAAAINQVSDSTDVKAFVNETSIVGNSYTSATVNSNVTINNIVIDISTGVGLEDIANLQNVANSINLSSGQTGVTAIFDGNPTVGIQLVAEDGRNIIIEDSGANAANTLGLATAGTFAGTFTLVSEDGSPINLDSTTGNISNAGLAVGTFSGSNSGAIGSEVGANALVTGDIVINGVPVGPSQGSFDTASSANQASGAISKAEAINKVSDRTGVTAEVNKTINNGAAINSGTAETGNVSINGVQINIAYSASDTGTDIQNTVISAINNKAGQTGVSAEAFGATFRLIAEDGRNIEIGTLAGITTANSGITAGSTQSSLSLKSAGSIELSSITGDIQQTGFDIGTYGSSESGQLIKDINISTAEGAIDALAAVDNALTTINFQRANLGAIQNRFESTMTNQAIAAENFTEASSRIRDADFAAETAELSRSQVLQQAGLSILSQANSQPQQVLQLLQG
jgi:flagellin